MKWPKIKLKEIASRIQYGFTASASEEDVGPKFLRITDIVPDHISWETVPYCEINENDREKYLLQVGDIVIARTGNTTGYAKLIREDHHSVFASYLIRVQVEPSKAIPAYVGHIVESSLYKSFVNSQKGGSAQGNANAQVLTQFELPLPKLDEQQRIAETLSAYDDLIENNRRRISLLEESARLLYREWFVRLRFPGHEHTRIVNGVPEGWRKLTLGDICTDNREMVSPESLEPDTPYIGLEHMPRRSISLSDWGTAGQVTSSKLRFHTGDILFGKIRPYFHKVGIAFTDGLVSSDAFVIRPTAEALKSFVLMTVSSDEFIADTSQAMKEGSKMPRADWKQMIQYPVNLPPDGLLADFTETITSITGQLRNLSTQNQKLRTARDLLLPKLMSGKIEV